MTIMRHSVDIARSPEQVLAYAGTATRWPEWHPSSLRVDGIAGPLPAGSRFEEDIHAGGRDGHLSWEVTDYLPGRRWLARASGNHGLRLLLTYECEATDSGARFTRTLEYRFAGLAGLTMRLLDPLLLRRRIRRESEESMLRLRQMAEQAIPAS